MLKKIFSLLISKVSVFMSGVCLFFIAPAVTSAQEVFLGQIILVPYTFCPRSYAETNGALLPINQYSALFSLLGCTYGGDCRTTFGLPDIRGRVVVNHGQGPGLSNYSLGQKLGTEYNTPTINTMANHSHSAATTTTLKGTTDTGTQNVPTGNMLADDGTDRIYKDNPTPTNIVDMNAGSVASSTTVSSTGGNIQVNNRQPVLTLRYCIALQGIFPSRN